MAFQLDFGERSSGTLRTIDLLRAFEDDLIAARKASEGETYATLHALSLDVTRAIGMGDDPDDPEAQEAILHDLMDALQEFTPAYAYVGSLGGDGACWGVWLDWYVIEMAVYDGEVTEVADLSEAEENGTYLLINDHGNAALYSIAEGEATELWAVV